MREDCLPIFCCPLCHSDFELYIKYRAKQDIHSGTLKCVKCSAVFHIFRGRPVFLRDCDFITWVSPIDEALNPNKFKKPLGALSLQRLNEIGVEKAVKIAGNSKYDKSSIKSEKVLNNLISIENKIRYRANEKWLKSRGRKESILNSLNNPLKSVKIFAETVAKEKPKRILDAASGSGSGIASVANRAKGVENIFAIERDLKCLWSLQNRFKLLKREKIFEAVGADVRKLPFPENSFDAVTTMMALQEIQGIDFFLEEISRVLCPGGVYAALYTKEPLTYGIIEKNDYRKFAVAAKLFSGHKDFIKTALHNGLRTDKEFFFLENNTELCLTVFRK